MNNKELLMPSAVGQQVVNLLSDNVCPHCNEEGIWSAFEAGQIIGFQYNCFNCDRVFQHVCSREEVERIVDLRLIANRIQRRWLAALAEVSSEIESSAENSMLEDDIDTQILKGRVSREVQKLIYRDVEGEEMTAEEEWTADVIDVINEVLGLGIDLHPAWESAPEGRKIATACERAGVERAVFVKTAARLVSERYPDRPGLEGKLLMRWRRSRSLPGMIETGWKEYRKGV